MSTTCLFILWEGWSPFLPSASWLWQCLREREWWSSPSPQTLRANGPRCVRFWVLCAMVQYVLHLRNRVWKRSWQTPRELLGWVKVSNWCLGMFHVLLILLIWFKSWRSINYQQIFFSYIIDCTDSSCSYESCVGLFWHHLLYCYHFSQQYGKTFLILLRFMFLNQIML